MFRWCWDNSALSVTIQFWKMGLKSTCGSCFWLSALFELTTKSLFSQTQWPAIWTGLQVVGQILKSHKTKLLQLKQRLIVVVFFILERNNWGKKARGTPERLSYNQITLSNQCSPSVQKESLFRMKCWHEILKLSTLSGQHHLNWLFQQINLIISLAADIRKVVYF